MRTLLMAVSLMIGLLASPALGQSAELAENQKAVISFDIQLQKLMNSEMAQTLGLSDKLSDAVVKNEDSLDPGSVIRIFGAVSAPESMEAMQSFKGEGTLPLDFFARVEMVDAAAATKAIEELKEKSVAVEMGGKTYYRPEKDDSPDNIMATLADETTLEFGTTAWLTRADRSVFSEGLTESWKKTPDEAVRIAMDMVGATELINAAIEQGKQAVPPNFAAFVELLGAAKDLRISIDLEGANLLTIGATGKSESDAEDLQGGLNTLVGFGQMAGTQYVGMLKQQSPDLGNIVEKLLADLGATLEGDNVTLAIPRPEGLGAAIQGMMGP